MAGRGAIEAIGVAVQPGVGWIVGDSDGVGFGDERAPGWGGKDEPCHADRADEHQECADEERAAQAAGAPP